MSAIGRAILWIGGLIIVAAMIGSHDSPKSNATAYPIGGYGGASPQYSPPAYVPQYEPPSTCTTSYYQSPRKNSSLQVTTTCK